MVDPRRPLSAGGPREEGLMPYAPEVPLPPTEIISYNQSLPRVTGIYSAPTGLESTCIVFVYGLGGYYAPPPPIIEGGCCATEHVYFISYLIPDELSLVWLNLLYLHVKRYNFLSLLHITNFIKVVIILQTCSSAGCSPVRCSIL